MPNIAENPAEGGSYVLDKDGQLIREEAVASAGKSNDPQDLGDGTSGTEKASSDQA